jgi:hypothetical protein
MMRFAVELFLELSANVKLDNFWSGMKQSGISSYMTESGYKPYLTLLGVPERDKI